MTDTVGVENGEGELVFTSLTDVTDGTNIVGVYAILIACYLL